MNLSCGDDDAPPPTLRLLEMSIWPEASIVLEGALQSFAIEFARFSSSGIEIIIDGPNGATLLQLVEEQEFRECTKQGVEGSV